MKTMKKTLALALVIIMMLGLATVAYADEEPAAPTYTLTITNATKGHTYKAYQIFTGTYADPEAGYTVGTLSNVEWGESVTSVTEGKLVTTNTKLNGLTAEDIAERMSNGYAATTDAPAIALNELLAAVALKAEAYKSSGTYNETDKTYTISGLQAGYYVVKDSFTPGSVVAEGDTLSTTIVQVMGNETMDPKSSAPKSEKKIRDTNDSTNSNNGWEDSADYDIGDEVPFRITFTLPSNYEEYDAYQVIVHDHQEAGLTFNANTVQVLVLDNGEYFDITKTANAFNVATGSDVTDGCTFHIYCDDITKIDKTVDGKSISLTNGDEIVFRYTSTLNEGANIGVDGNLNTSHVQFSNNPEGSGTNNTPDDTVIAFTYKVIVNKIDTAGNPLAGAGFTLYKFVRNENGGGVEYKVDGNVYTGSWEEVSEVTPGADVTTFTFEGLDDGYYKLVESKTPEGYNSIDDVTFTVEASHVTEMNIDSENRDEVLTDLTGNVVTGELTFTESLTDCSLSTNVVNAKGTILPETGGIGTTMFYAIGGLLVVAAMVMLITKKRMAANN